jgi:hypothetical protein
MDHFSELEFGGSEELVVGLGGQQLGDGLEVRVGGGPERFVKFLGLAGLLLGEMLERHGGDLP